MFMLTETKIISEYSAILSGRDTSNTAVIASLIFLLSGQDFAETETKDTKEIKEAKKNAVKAYINKELFRLSERNQVGNLPVDKGIFTKWFLGLTAGFSVAAYAIAWLIHTFC